MGEHGEGLREVLNLGAANNAHGVWLDEDRIGFVAVSYTHLDVYKRQV